MNYDAISNSIKFYETMVKLNRKNIYNFIGAIILNIGLVLINIPMDTLMNKIAIGCLGMNSLWQLFFLWDSFQDYNYSKEMLNIYKKHETYKERQDSINQYNHAKEYYESFIKPELFKDAK